MDAVRFGEDAAEETTDRGGEDGAEGGSEDIEEEERDDADEVDVDGDELAAGGVMSTESFKLSTPSEMKRFGGDLATYE